MYVKKMLKPSRVPNGYRNLLAFQKAEDLQHVCSEITNFFPETKTLVALADQMNRSARSVKQNIVEGWKRNSTREYYEFLGFSIGANTELEEDCNDIWKKFYPDLRGVKGVMGVMGETGIRGEMGIKISLSVSFYPLYPFDIEKLKFYPLDQSLPPIVQIKLRCKELNYLLHKLQNSLAEKMEKEKTLNVGDRYAKMKEDERRKEQFAEKLAEECRGSGES